MTDNEGYNNVESAGGKHLKKRWPSKDHIWSGEWGVVTDNGTVVITAVGADDGGTFPKSESFHFSVSVCHKKLLFLSSHNPNQ